MAAKDIESGRAYVLLRIRNQMSQGLAAAEKRLKNFGSTVAKAGGVLAGGGATAMGVFGGMAKMFADSSSELGDMANRTGLAREYLSQLGFAAKMSGTDMETVEAAVRKSSDALGSAMGNKQSAETFKQLGFSVEELMAMSPENRFEALGKKVAGIRDPALRTAMAMNVFGKSGTGLIDMFSNLEAAKQQSDSLGLTINDSDIRAGEALGDALDTVFATIKGIGMQVGAALATPLTQFLTIASNVIAMVSNFIRENRNMVVIVASVVTIITAAGFALVTVGGIIAAVGFAIGGLISFFSFLAAAIAFIFSPMGIAIGLFVAAVGAAIYYRDEIIAAVVAVGQWLRKMVDYAATAIDVTIITFGGFAKALASGNLALAARIGFMKMKLEITKVLNQIVAGFMVFLNQLTDKISQWSGGRVNLGGFDLAKQFSSMGGSENAIKKEIDAMNVAADLGYKLNPAAALGDAIDATGVGVSGVMKNASDFMAGLGNEVKTAFKPTGGPMMELPGMGTSLEKAGSKVSSKGTFSAAGAALMSAGSDFNQQTAKNTSILVQQNKEMLKKKGAQFK